MRRKPTLHAKLALLVAMVAVLCVLVGAALGSVLPLGLAAIIGSVVAALVAVAGATWAARPFARYLVALRDAASGIESGDFSLSLVEQRDDELGDLARVFNRIADGLRDERRTLLQREHLLHSVIEHTPMALLLLDSSGKVVLSNPALNKLLGCSRKLQGAPLADLLEQCPATLRHALQQAAQHPDSLTLNVAIDAAAATRDAAGDITPEPQRRVVHVSSERIVLHAQYHQLVMLRDLTQALQRHEVNAWKKLIRIMNHELNNSLAPISSQAFSASLLLERGQTEDVAVALQAIGERSKHLAEFLARYAEFARLPEPRIESVDPSRFFPQLLAVAGSSNPVLKDALPNRLLRFDPAQIEQALLNILRNAEQAGGPPGSIRLAVRNHAPTGGIEITVLDAGPGMEDSVLQSALLPFFSTRQGGTGLGLALVREIVEAHGGRVTLANRPPLPTRGTQGTARNGRNGGLAVTLTLPNA